MDTKVTFVPDQARGLSALKAAFPKAEVVGLRCTRHGVQLTFFEPNCRFCRECPTD